MTPLVNSPAVLKTTLAATRAASRLSPRLAGRLVARLWFTPWRLPLGERALAKQDWWLEPTRPIQIAAGGLLLKGYEGGEGPTVLLVHGWGDSSRSMGAFVRPLIDRGFKVVAVDGPGHGDTSGGQSDALQLAAAVRAAIADRGPVYAVVAHSMGAHAAMQALHDGPEVERAVFISPAVFLESAVGPFVQMFGLSDAVVAPLKAEIDRRFGKSIWSAMAATRLVQGVDVPVLVLHDPDDPQVPFEDAEQLVDSWDRAQLVPIEGIGHTKILRDADVIERAVSFLERPFDASRSLGSEELVTSDA